MVNLLDEALLERLYKGIPNAVRDDNATKEGRLNQSEFFWRDHYHWLKEKGYLLRPRYHPEWVASWAGTDECYVLCEDGQVAFVRPLSS